MYNISKERKREREGIDEKGGGIKWENRFLAGEIQVLAIPGIKTPW